MDTKQAAATLRAQYKAAGWNARMVSVRTSYFSMGSSLRVTVRSADVDFAKAKAMAENVERISRCEITGEILSGGNRYVHVDMSEECQQAVAARHLDAVRTAVAELGSMSSQTHATVAGTDATVSAGRWDDAFQLWLGQTHYAVYQRSEAGLVDAAVAIATIPRSGLHSRML